jgi:UDP-N-acetylglucosamine--N-acetylmuramyl-(pentapeptide) pyrophosphoryl-undecaprenol N-acetylglucosamine transferase
MGSVTPLLAVVEELRLAEPQTEFFWLGTKDGPEQKILSEYQIPFFAISGGKFRRYFSLQNFVDPFRVVAGFFQGWSLIRKIRPQIILTAGAFISVPVVWAARFFRVPVIVHQQDIVPGLANRLMERSARKITVTFESSLRYFPREKTVWIGNPVRHSIVSGNTELARQNFGLEPEVPVVLVVGGGTGALALNQAVLGGLEQLLSFCQLIHITGAAKDLAPAGEIPRYHHYEFLTGEMKDALAVADVVVSRAGLGFLTELAALGKAVILIPMADSHQEANATYFAKNNAILFLPPVELTSENLVRVINNLLSNRSDRANLERNIKTVMKWGAEKEMVKLILELTKKD